MSYAYIPLVTPPERRDEPALWFAFRKAEILVVNGADRPALPHCLDLAEHGLAPQRRQYLGLAEGATACGPVGTPIPASRVGPQSPVLQPLRHTDRAAHG